MEAYSDRLIVKEANISQFRTKTNTILNKSVYYSSNVVDYTSNVILPPM